MNTKQGGFIPLLALILLGLAVIAGGTVTAVSIHNKAKVADQPVTETVVEATSTPLGAVSPRDEGSRATTTIDRTTEVQARVIKKTATSTNEAIDDRAVQKRIEAQRKNIDQEITKIQEDIAAVKELTIQQESPYDNGKCQSEKKSLASQADSLYLNWYDQWMNARKTIDSCYSSNPVPTCDKQMSELNVEWQQRLKDSLTPMYAKLTSCAPEDRHFHDVTASISAPY